MTRSLPLGFKQVFYDKKYKGYLLVFSDQSNSSKGGTFFYHDDVINGSAARSFNVGFTNQYTHKFLTDFITALITAIDPAISKANAISAANELVTSFSGGHSDILPSRVGFSKIVPIGEYFLIIENDDNFISNIYAYHKNEINLPADKSQYAELTYDQIKLNQNVYQKVHLNGIVEYQYSSVGDHFPQTNVIFTSFGNRYRAIYFPYYLPINFETGKEYSFYGVLDANQDGVFATMYIKFVEEINAQ